jgi:transcriptional regulator GlxA family with amidase domain
MTLAAHLLRETDTPVDQVARRVGYGSPFAFSRAFSRVHAEAPTHFRRRLRDG